MIGRSSTASLRSDYTKTAITRDLYQQGKRLYTQGQLSVTSGLRYLQLLQS